jgi:type IV fimbrial biogenesis protein FimT
MVKTAPHAPSEPPRSAGGFTLIELLVTLTVLSVVLAIAIPSFQDFLRRNRLAAETNNLVSALSYARSEAIKLGRPVSVCGVSDPEATPPVCAADAWSSGWIVFVDSLDSLGDATGDTLLRVHQPNTADMPDIAPPENFSTYLSYQSNGGALGEDGAPDGDDIFNLCVDEVARDIKVGVTGRVSIEEGACP